MQNLQSLLLPLILFAAIGVMMYFSVKKQRRNAAAAKEMQGSIVPGTRVMTTSGLQGNVTAIADDTIELEIAPGVRTTWIRAAVREVVVPAPSAGAPDLEAIEDESSDSQISMDKRKNDLN